MKPIFFVSAMCMIASSCANNRQNLNYPEAPCDSTSYEAFGMRVDDRFRPLENDTAEATLAWVKAENELTESYLSKIPFRDDIRKRLTELNDFAKTGLPWLDNDSLYYWSANSGLQNQSTIYRATKPYGDDAEAFIDPNTLSDDGTVALTGLHQSKNGKYTAYTISRSGSDWTEIYVLDTKTKQLLDDHIEWAKFTGAAWDGDKGFYYSAYPRPEKGKEFSNANEYHTVYYHELGTPQSQDKVVYENREQPLYFHSAGISDDGRWLIVSGSGQGFGNALYVKDLKNPSAKWITIEPSMGSMA